MEATPPAPPRTWRRWFRRVCAQTVVLWTLYTLSIGPMFWQWHEAATLSGPKWIAAFYLPLLLVCEYIPPFGRLVNWYINLWIL